MLNFLLIYLIIFSGLSTGLYLFFVAAIILENSETLLTILVEVFKMIFYEGFLAIALISFIVEILFYMLQNIF